MFIININFHKQRANLVIYMYTIKKWSASIIAEIFKCSDELIYIILRKHGIKRRTNSEAGVERYKRWKDGKKPNITAQDQ